MNISISSEAQEKLQGIIKQNDSEHPAVRIFFAGYGWSGPELGLTLDESKDKNDASFNLHDINFLMDKGLKNRIGDTTPVAIDFQRSFFGERFVVSYGSEACCE